MVFPIKEFRDKGNYIKLRFRIVRFTCRMEWYISLTSKFYCSLGFSVLQCEIGQVLFLRISVRWLKHKSKGYFFVFIFLTIKVEVLVF